jgi:hypothetical protein
MNLARHNDTTGGPGDRTGRTFVLIYNADGTLRGELTYVIGHHVLGTLSCELCDISHGPIMQKKAWKQWRAAMLQDGHVVRVIHRNDMSQELALFVGDQLATVVEQHSESQWSVVLRPDELKECAGSVVKFASMMQRALNTL